MTSPPTREATPTLVEDLQWVGTRTKLCIERGTWLRQPRSDVPEPPDCNDCLHCEWNARLARLRAAATRLREALVLAREMMANEGHEYERGRGAIDALIHVNEPGPLPSDTGRE